MIRARPASTLALLLAVTSAAPAACRNVVSEESPDSHGHVADAGVCAPGFADCNGNPSDGCEVDLASDGAHCGACARTCLGEACAAGVCAPRVLLEHVAFGRRLALDASSIYFTSADVGGTVNQVGLDGGPVSTLAAGQDDVYDIAVDPGGIYWTCINAAAVRALPAGSALPVDLATEGTPFALQLQGDRVYFTQIYSKVSESEHVMRVPAAGGPDEALAATPAALYLAVDAERVYWTDPTTGALWQAPLAGGPPAALASALVEPSEVVVEGDAVFFNTIEGTFTVPRAGGSVTRLASGAARGLAVDATHVYLGTYDGLILKVPRGGGAAVTLAKTGTYPNDLAVDGARVYWLEGQQEGSLRVTSKE